MSKRNSMLSSVLGAAAGGLAAYLIAIRPWMMRWGAFEAEVRRWLPGDHLVPHARVNATHAVTIGAPPAAVWPWLVQLGRGRGGFYSFEWIENLLGADIHNADRVLPEFQGLAVGDVIPFAKGGFGVPVAILEQERALVLHGDSRSAGPGNGPPVRPGEYIAVSWGFYLEALPDRMTRLIERWKADWTPTLANELFYRAFLEPGAFVMERQMLLGLKARVEGLRLAAEST